MLRTFHSALPAILSFLAAGTLHAQNAPPTAASPAPGRGGPGRSAYPQRPPADAAVRELEEETGYSAKHWRKR